MSSQQPKAKKITIAQWRAEKGQREEGARKAEAQRVQDVLLGRQLASEANQDVDI
jgi:hypothetical protein